MSPGASGSTFVEPDFISWALKDVFESCLNAALVT